MRSPPRNPPAAPRGDSGVGLVELIVVMVLMGVVGSITTTLIVSSLRSSQVVAAQADSADQARLGVDRLTRELRGARTLLPLPAGTAPETAVRVWVDDDGDGVMTAAEDVSYRFGSSPAGGLLERSTAAEPAWQTLALRLAAGSRFDLPATPAGAPPLLRITVQARSDDGPGDRLLTVGTTVRLRNSG